MGVRDLHTKFIGRPNHEKKDKKPQNHLSEIKGAVGIDVSTLMYRSLCSQEASSVFDVDDPKVPLFSAYNSFISALRTLREKHKLDVVLCFDNKSHPMKADTQTERRATRQYHLEELRKLYQLGSSNDAIMASIADHRKKLAYPREDLIAMIVSYCKKNAIKYCAAAFEADWQLVSLQQQGLIQNIISSDGDLFVLGGDNIITELNISSGACCIYRRELIMQRKSIGGGAYSKKDLPVLSCLTGNDYINRLSGNGPKSVHKLMYDYTELQSLEEQQSFIYDLQTNSTWKQGEAKPATGFYEKFWKAYYLHVYAPVLHLGPRQREM